ncbi:hypothetical protein [Pollutimonas bauzanensis]|uniref:Uncharacterized protein n=1 Tax=Pollutimonas bauzanensis TaxID=658167 RepID=A0A1M5ZPN9_9BURK|nr:hypothetical protein [Pollutimonas bauzanensis]SHI26182.1 hypothetical protein SAMN04488135_11717 [Pollutimonas bauzanensis]
MTTATDSYRQKLTALVGLLSCGDLDEHETARIVGICVQARSDPAKTLKDNYGADAAKVAQYDPQGAAAFIIFVELEDYFAVADTVDELHEQIIDAFEHPALPEYPYDNNNFETLPDYYRWVDQQLQTHHEKYCLISFGESYTHDFQVILVYRDKQAEILALCEDLGMRAGRCA